MSIELQMVAVLSGMIAIMAIVFEVLKKKNNVDSLIDKVIKDSEYDVIDDASSSLADRPDINKSLYTIPYGKYLIWIQRYNNNIFLFGKEKHRFGSSGKQVDEKLYELISNISSLYSLDESNYQNQTKDDSGIFYLQSYMKDFFHKNILETLSKEYSAKLFTEVIENFYKDVRAKEKK